MLRAWRSSCRRDRLQQGALAKWRLSTVQGECSSTPGIFAPGLDLRLYTTGCVTAQWRAWALNKKIQETDISPLAYRCIRAVGGNWRERLELSEAPRAALGPILPDQVLSFLSDTAWDAATCRHGLCGYGAAQTFHVVLLKPAGGLTGAPQQVSRCPVVAPALFYSETWEIGRGSEPVQGHLQLKPLLSRLTVSTTANDEKLGRSSVRSQTGTNISGNLLVLRSSIEVATLCLVPVARAHSHR